MRRRIRGTEEEDDINMTPMLDIVFIMLIFFIVTASFVKESGIELKRPGGDNTQKDKPKKNTSLLVVINEEGFIWVGRRQVDVRAVRANIERAVAQDSDLSSVVIQVAEDSKNEVLVKVMDAARQAGMNNVTITPG